MSAKDEPDPTDTSALVRAATERTQKLTKAIADLEHDMTIGDFSGGGYRYVEATPDALRTVLDALKAQDELMMQMRESAAQEADLGYKFEERCDDIAKRIRALDLKNPVASWR